MKTIILVILLILPAMMFCSCSAPQDKVETKLEAEEIEAPVEEEVSREAQTNKPLYVYGETNDESSLSEVILKLKGEPLLLKGQEESTGYVRLVGVVSGGKPRALLELGGRGVFIGLGDNVSGYRVADIYQGKVFLVKEMEEVKK
ncbi:MAG: hypothetical protein KKA31_03155 [Candidatus Margulisbacteria bacterium]|nr:hypothetical protein [Candidatus Margulisiibacteriota bacterium]